MAVMEATTVTGAARSMLEFCRAAREPQTELSGATRVEVSLVTFERQRDKAPLAPEEAEQELESNRRSQPNEFVVAARRLGVEVDVINESFRFDLRVIPQLRRIVRQRRPDIIVTHHVKSHFLLKISRLWREVPWAAFHHGYTTTDAKMRAYNALDRWSLPGAHRVVTVCEAFARELAGKGVRPERISVQHNSIRVEPAASLEEARALRLSLGVRETERLVLVIGRLSREKAHIDLLDAFALLQSSHPELKTKLLIIGDGPERGALERAAQVGGMSERVIFAGQLSDVNAYYAAADVMALPSHSEGSPYVLLEAMAAGLPVVATAVGGVPEMVTDGESALLVAPRDASAMADALHRILTDEELARRLTVKASALILTRYSPETHLQSLVGIYRQTISDAATKP
jgi:glycosyltransferase involved in cell wall biosynthesis